MRGGLVRTAAGGTLEVGVAAKAAGVGAGVDMGDSMLAADLGGWAPALGASIVSTPS